MTYGEVIAYRHGSKLMIEIQLPERGIPSESGSRRQSCGSAQVDWSSPGFPDGLVRLGKGGFMLGRTSLAESGVPPLPIVEDLDVLKEIRPRRGP